MLPWMSLAGRSNKYTWPYMYGNRMKNRLSLLEQMRMQRCNRESSMVKDLKDSLTRVEIKLASVNWNFQQAMKSVRMFKQELGRTTTKYMLEEMSREITHRLMDEIYKYVPKVKDINDIVSITLPLSSIVFMDQESLQRKVLEHYKYKPMVSMFPRKLDDEVTVSVVEIKIPSLRIQKIIN